MLQDMAVLTGAQLISEELGLKLEDAIIEQLGWARRVVRRRRLPRSRPEGCSSPVARSRYGIFRMVGQVAQIDTAPTNDKRSSRRQS